MVAKFRETDSNGEVPFVIRDLEKFRVLTEITVLPFFRKFEFSWVLQRVMLNLWPNTRDIMYLILKGRDDQERGERRDEQVGPHEGL